MRNLITFLARFFAYTNDCHKIDSCHPDWF
jgi:hypothetical protein